MRFQPSMIRGHTTIRFDRGSWLLVLFIRGPQEFKVPRLKKIKFVE